MHRPCPSQIKVGMILKTSPRLSTPSESSSQSESMKHYMYMPGPVISISISWEGMSLSTGVHLQSRVLLFEVRSCLLGCAHEAQASSRTPAPLEKNVDHIARYCTTHAAAASGRKHLTTGGI